MSKIATIDLDFVKYASASIAETRTIKVIHKSSGNEKVFKNKTEFYGRGKNKDGGWLGELNKEKGSGFEHTDFIIEELQEITEPIQNVLHSAKMMVEKGLKGIGTTKYEAFLGKGDSFRVELSTLWKYKGQRAETLRPLMLDDVSDYLAKKFNAEYVTGLEVDDRVVIEATADSNKVILGVDKDFYQSPVYFYNPNRPIEGIIDCRGFGGLYRDVKGKVRGKGRSWLYHQMASHDLVDNYKANCFSDYKWGEVKSYGILSGSTNDKEAWEGLIEVFQTLYPEPKVITGWRGIEIEIDYMYVMQEMANMAHMRRNYDDALNVETILESLGVNYEQ